MSERRHPAVDGFTPDAEDIVGDLPPCPLCGGAFRYWPGSTELYCVTCGNRPDVASALTERVTPLRVAALPSDAELLAFAETLRSQPYSYRTRNALIRKRFGISAARFWQGVYRARLRAMEVDA